MNRSTRTTITTVTTKPMILRMTILLGLTVTQPACWDNMDQPLRVPTWPHDRPDANARNVQTWTLPPSARIGWKADVRGGDEPPPSHVQRVGRA